MSQALDETNRTTPIQSDVKQTWATPTIESYDIAQFTLGTGQSRFDSDQQSNFS